MNRSLRQSGPAQSRHPRAFCLLEMMIVVVVLSIIGVGVGVGMQAAVKAPEVTDQALAISTELTSEMENWRAVTFGKSPWPAVLPYTLTDTVTLKVGGQQLVLSRTTTIKLWDPNNLATNASPQADFAQVLITINGQSLTLYLTKPV